MEKNFYDRKGEFKEQLRRIINSYSIDNDCDMHDFVLAEYIIGQIETLRIALKKEKELYNKYVVGIDPYKE